MLHLPLRVNGRQSGRIHQSFEGRLCRSPEVAVLNARRVSGETDQQACRSGPHNATFMQIIACDKINAVKSVYNVL